MAFFNNDSFSMNCLKILLGTHVDEYTMRSSSYLPDLEIIFFKWLHLKKSYQNRFSQT